MGKPGSRVDAQLPHTVPTTLFVTPTIPRPDGIGVQKRAWAHLQTLRAIGDVQLLVLLTAPQCQAQGGEPALQAARALGVSATLGLLGPARQPVAAGGLMQRVRQRLAQFGSPRFTVAADSDLQGLAQRVASGAFDLLFFFRTSTLSTLRQLVDETRDRAPVVADFDDVESVAQARELRHTWRMLGVEASLFKCMDIVEQRQLEQLVQRRARLVTVCSDLDAERIRRRRGAAQVMVIPNTVPDRPPLAPTPAHPGLTLLFLGAMNYEPNEDAALYFVQDVLPLLKQQLAGQVRLMIVGRAPTPAVLALQRDSCVQVHADVPEVDRYYQQADIVVVPIRFGGGTRIKIIEALAMGRPVVSTTLGAEGLGLQDGHDVLIADTSAAFAQACCRLGGDSGLRAAIVASGLSTFRHRYSDVRVRELVAGRLRALLQ